MGSPIIVLRILFSFLLCSTLILGRFLSDDNLFREVKRLTKKRTQTQYHKLYFKTGTALPAKTVGSAHDNIVLECQSGGKPASTIHWLKDKHRIQQGPSRDYQNDEPLVEEILNENIGSLIGIGSTRAKLYLDCLSPEDVGKYTCVAETTTQRISQSTEMSISGRYSSEEHEKCIVKKSISSEAARIYLWTRQRLEVSGASVQLMCRAQGSPRPTVTWATEKGKEIKHSTDKYEVLSNGDLLIRNISWKDKGSYTCSAANENGIDKITTFLYPARRKS